MAKKRRISISGRDSEADVRRKYIDKKLSAADWQDNQILAEKYFTDGPIRTIGGNKAIRKEGKKADYLLRYSRDFLIAVVEAKKKNADDGLQQAKDYAEILDLKFAYSTDGKEIIEYDYTTGLEQIIQNFPSPDELWNRLMRHQGIEPSIQEILLKPFFNVPKKPPRYYQRIAVNRAVRHTLEGTDRLLLTMATGTGKTYTAFQIIYKLWESRWNKKGEYRRPKILFLADRSILVEDPMTKEFSAFGQALYQIQGEISLGREVYFATYQSIAEDERRPGLFREFPENFFDLIVIDECHRGSARRESSWRRILNHFHSATQLGLTATPKRDDNVDTYLYFGNPIYTYSLDQGIQDGFLAPYINRRVVPSADATGWRPYRGQQDKHGREIPDGTYGTADFERSLSLLPRTKAVARHLTDFLKRTRRFAKTIIFCEDSEHANQVRRELNNLNSDLTRQYPDYVVRIVSKEGDIGRGHLSNFMDVDKETPVLVTTSKLLTTGVDVQTCKNIVIFRVINSMTEFKQIIGRGTRIWEDDDPEKNKLFFTILDYTGSASRLFADPEFDGFPSEATIEEMNEEGQVVAEETDESLTDPNRNETEDASGRPFVEIEEDESGERRKYYVEDGVVNIVAETVQYLDADGRQMRTLSYTDYTREQITTLYSSADELRTHWSTADERNVILDQLLNAGIDLDYLAEVTGQDEADPFDLLCFVAFNAPIYTRKQRAERLRRNKTDFFDQYKGDARDILNIIVDKYVEHGLPPISDTDILKVPAISKYGNIIEIASQFGGIDQLRTALSGLQQQLYAA